MNISMQNEESSIFACCFIYLFYDQYKHKNKTMKKLNVKNQWGNALQHILLIQPYRFICSFHFIGKVEFILFFWEGGATFSTHFSANLVHSHYTLLS